MCQVDWPSRSCCTLAVSASQLLLRPTTSGKRACHSLTAELGSFVSHNFRPRCTVDALSSPTSLAIFYRSNILCPFIPSPHTINRPLLTICGSPDFHDFHKNRQKSLLEETVTREFPRLGVVRSFLYLDSKSLLLDPQSKVFSRPNLSTKSHLSKHSTYHTVR